MTYEYHFKVALIRTGNNGSPAAYLLTPSGSFIRLFDGHNDLEFPVEDLTTGEIDSNRDDSYGMPR